MMRDLADCWVIGSSFERWNLEITGGNAEVAENRRIAKRAIRKVMQGKKLKIDGLERGKKLGLVSDNGSAIAIVGWGHPVCPFYAAAKWRCVPVLPRTCGGGELRRVVPSQSKVDGSAPADGPPSYGG
jgi:hypothetical protein